MTAPLLATRDALARALFDADFGDPEQAAKLWASLSDDLLPKLSYFRTADALLASGVVRDPATLADDLCKRLCDMAGEPRLFIPGEIRAVLAAALTEAPS